MSSSPDMSFGRIESLTSVHDRFSSSKERCLSKIGRQKVLNIFREEMSGMNAGTDFIVLPETSLNVEPDAIPSIVDRLSFRK